ncbi:hypothetical protein GCM10010176_104450 [Nonomuraea spiralis]|nr:hypothetical protein GCM10010176_104450 [Nonomuraea spiralis]
MSRWCRPGSTGRGLVAHDLVRKSVTETIARLQAVQLHLRVADALEHIHADRESVAERLAYHLRGAGP